MPHVVPQEVLDMLMVPSTATISSALKSVAGIDNAFMHGGAGRGGLLPRQCSFARFLTTSLCLHLPAVSPCKPGCHMAGPAYTLRYIPARSDLDDRKDMPHGGENFSLPHVRRCGRAVAYAGP